MRGVFHRYSAVADLAAATQAKRFGHARPRLPVAFGRLLAILSSLLLAVATTLPTAAYDREDWEEDAGSGFSVLFSPHRDLYGIALGSGTWLRNAPVFGDYGLSLYRNGRQDTLYSGVGLTLRIMPRWTWAPFCGGGGGYSHALTRPHDRHDDARSAWRGESYASGHAEVGIRVWIGGRRHYIDAAYRQTWTSLRGDRDYGLILLGLGSGIGAAPYP